VGTVLSAFWTERLLGTIAIQGTSRAAENPMYMYGMELGQHILLLAMIWPAHPSVGLILSGVFPLSINTVNERTNI
jgi:hypothetical protein